jgi:hypothetical protein
MPTRDDPNVMLMIGQLLEGVKAASEAVKGLSDEVRGNATAIITAAKSLEMIEERLSHVTELVLDSSNPNNLVSRIDGHNTQLLALAAEFITFRQAVAEVRKTLDAQNLAALSVQHTRTGAQKVIGRIVQGAGWAITAAIAVWAAIAQGCH